MWSSAFKDDETRRLGPLKWSSTQRKLSVPSCMRLSIVLRDMKERVMEVVEFFWQLLLRSQIQGRAKVMESGERSTWLLSRVTEWALEIGEVWDGNRVVFPRFLWWSDEFEDRDAVESCCETRVSGVSSRWSSIKAWTEEKAICLVLDWYGRVMMNEMWWELNDSWGRVIATKRLKMMKLWESCGRVVRRLMWRREIDEVEYMLSCWVMR